MKKKEDEWLGIISILHLHLNFTELFDILTMEEESAVAVVQLTKSNCTLDRRNLRDCTAEVWKHYGYYPSKLKLDTK